MDTITRGHAQTARKDLRSITSELVSGLGSAAVAFLAGINDTKQPNQWVKADGPLPKTEAERKIRAAYRIWLLLDEREGAPVARAWFIGCNPFLDERTPLTAIREGDEALAIRAAEAFTDVPTD